MFGGEERIGAIIERGKDVKGAELWRVGVRCSFKGRQTMGKKRLQESLPLGFRSILSYGCLAESNASSPGWRKSKSPILHNDQKPIAQNRCFINSIPPGLGNAGHKDHIVTCLNKMKHG